MKRFTLLKKEKGSTIVLISLAFMALVAMTGLVIDGGMLYMTKSHLQKVANNTVLSGAQELTTEDEQKVSKVVDEVLLRHNETASLNNLNVILNNQVSVELQKPVDLTFAKLFGIETVSIDAHATAKLSVMGKAVGAAPLGIPESTELTYGEEYKLKVDSADSTAGNFGILALEGPGAKLYEDNLRTGFQEELSVGEVVNTQTGNIAGKTRTTVNELINSCSDYNQRDCSRILLVLVYKPYEVQNNQVKQVEITGFAYFYITEPMGSNDTAITGSFLKRTGAGIADESAVNRGAYTIRLSE